ncbi:hypothetical protein [Corynebacterium gerontici]|uniref:Uncharacterized protein n=1 Tax=Corynebacterium gerontici TaxID=2079234 RepID=A0A3G6IYR2_9CORY|nr:hypothetical protein [Corynebacterium gerontici]AZA10796.1 hypothetical protein CGERO_02360 [Corynebacterium gerontici]
MPDINYLSQLRDVTNEGHFSFASKKAKQALSLSEKAFDDRDLSLARAAAEKAQSAEDESLKELHHSLQEVHPSAATHLIWGERHTELQEFKPPKGMRYFSCSRGAWILGVFGKGAALGQIAALKYFNKYVRWAAARLIKVEVFDVVSILEDERSSSREISQLELSRLTAIQTRMLWIADEITISAGEWVDENLPHCADSLGAGIMKIAKENRRSVRERLIRAAEQKSWKIEEPISKIHLRGLPEGLISELTAKPMVLNEENLKNALLGDGPAITPFVRIQEDTWVLGFSEWLQNCDDSIIRIVMRKSPSHHSGKVFEDITAKLLSKWGPTGMDWNSSIEIFKSGREGGRDEVDIFAVAEDAVFLGECKANRLSENNSSVGASFETVVKEKAADQLATRVSHWGSGYRPRLGQTHYPDAVLGFIVAFSSYGGLPWQSESLKRNVQQLSFPVFPLHSLIMAVSILGTAQQLKRYLEYRSEWLFKGMQNLDELEYLMGFLGDSNSQAAKTPEGAVPFYRQYDLNAEGRFLDPKDYENASDWKKQWWEAIKEHCVAVTP